jgi:predicted dehydrogenase
MSERKRYALVGTGGRAAFFYTAIVEDFKETSDLVAFCDVNQTRMDYANSQIAPFGVGPLPTYKSEDFERMIKEVKPDIVIVTTVDRTHHTYIIRAMELGCDVISEKPMTVDEVKCQEILDAVKRTGKHLRVTFNYRYSPHNTKIRELIMDGAIGDVTSVHFEWMLNTKHGADYFRRWHRDKRNSGGLLVHKSTHHFDLVNFWLGTQPATVYALGDLMFYGRENAEKRGVTEFYSRAHGSENAKNDPFALHMEKNDKLKAMYLDAEKEDGYYRDQSVFGDGINIEDTMGVIVKYRSNAILTYNLYAYSPWEGFRVNFNGTKGRIEMDVVEASYVNSGGDQALEGAVKGKKITVYPMFDAPYDVSVEESKGGHGGGDPVLLNDLFGKPAPDRFERAASHVDGAMSILTGIAGNRSIKTGLPVKVSELVQF